MSKIIWSNDNKYPVAAFGSGTAFTTSKAKPKKPVEIKEDDEDEILIDGRKIAPWFNLNNDFPNVTAQNYLRKSSSLISGINHKIKLGVGQGLASYKIKGIDENDQEILEPYFDPKLYRFLNSRMIRQYMYQAFQNVYEYGNAFPQMIMNEAGNYVSFLKNIDSPFCRFTKKEQGVIKYCLVSGKWPEVTEGDYELLNVLDLEGTEDEVYVRAKLLKNFIYPISLNTTGNIYYQLAPWDSARAGGHLDISIKIAEYLMYMFDNQMSIKYHIKIPYSYWEKKYPESNYKGPKALEERKAAIAKELDAIENNMTTTENAKKTITSHYETNQAGKDVEKWEIDVIDDKFTTDQYLPQAAASNAEILTSLGIHPAIMGLSLSSGPYANSGGGSDIREAFLIANALAWIERQEIIDPVEMAARINFKLGDDIVIRTRGLLLTTLDTGAGTEKIIS
jgi:hypothetical protein